jgi:hypothetical protein
MQAQEFYNPRVRTWKHAWRPQRRNLALPMFVVLLMCGGSANAAAQTVAPARDPRLSDLATGTAIIRGRVVSVGADAATLIRDARVSVSAPADSVDPVFTDADGHFEIKRRSVVSGIEVLHFYSTENGWHICGRRSPAG